MTSGEGQRVRVVLSALVAVLGFAGIARLTIAVVVTLTAGANPPGAEPSGTVQYSDLRPGDCFHYPAGGLFAHVVRLPCTQQHDAEVIATYEIQASNWPGKSAIQQDASTQCATLAQTNLDDAKLTSTMNISAFYPSSQFAWNGGDREIICSVHETSGSIAGSLRKSPVPTSS